RARFRHVAPIDSSSDRGRGTIAPASFVVRLQTLRRYLATASGANTPTITTIQMIDWITGFATGPPSIRPRVAFTTFVIGLKFTIGWSQPGIDDGGTKTELANVSGRMIRNPHVLTASGVFAVMPMKAIGQHRE